MSSKNRKNIFRSNDANSITDNMNMKIISTNTESPFSSQYSSQYSSQLHYNQVGSSHKSNSSKSSKSSSSSNNSSSSYSSNNSSSSSSSMSSSSPTISSSTTQTIPTKAHITPSKMIMIGGGEAKELHSQIKNMRSVSYRESVTRTNEAIKHINEAMNLLKDDSYEITQLLKEIIDTLEDRKVSYKSFNTSISCDVIINGEKRKGYIVGIKPTNTTVIVRTKDNIEHEISLSSVKIDNHNHDNNHNHNHKNNNDSQHDSINNNLKDDKLNKRGKNRSRDIATTEESEDTNDSSSNESSDDSSDESSDDIREIINNKTLPRKRSASIKRNVDKSTSEISENTLKEIKQNAKDIAKNNKNIKGGGKNTNKIFQKAGKGDKIGIIEADGTSNTKQKYEISQSDSSGPEHGLCE